MTAFWICSRYAARCTRCNDEIIIGERCVYVPETHRVFCHKQNCGPAVMAAQRAINTQQP